MKTLLEYCNEQQLKEVCLSNINEANEPIKLPYTFDIYNEGPKNKDYKITKANIYKIFFSIGKEEFEETDGEKVVKFVDSYNQMIRLPLPADKISYKVFPSKENTKNWTEIPELQEYTWAGAWYSSKFVEYNYQKYNKDWNEWFKMIKPYMRGKISVTVKQDDTSNDSKDKHLIFVINDDRFNKEREEKIKELKDPKHLKEWAEEAVSKEKAEIEKRKRDEEEKQKSSEEWNKWWNSLSDDEKLSWSMGYGKGSGNYTGD